MTQVAQLGAFGHVLAINKEAIAGIGGNVNNKLMGLFRERKNLAKVKQAAGRTAFRRDPTGIPRLTGPPGCREHHALAQASG